MLPVPVTRSSCRTRRLERNLVLSLAARSLHGLGRSGHAHRRFAASHELHPLRDYLDHVALLAVLRFPVARLEPPFHHDRAALVEILPQLSACFPHTTTVRKHTSSRF